MSLLLLDVICSLILLLMMRWLSGITFVRLSVGVIVGLLIRIVRMVFMRIVFLLMARLCRVVVMRRRLVSLGLLIRRCLLGAGRRC